MADTLIDAADCASPFDFTRLPDRILVVLGYIGQQGETPHLWSAEDVAKVRVTGRVWCPIHTVPPGPFTQQAGLQAANMMSEELTRYDYPPDGPVFLDVERSSWESNPGAAEDGANAWRHTMQTRGRPYAVPYINGSLPGRWEPNWTGVRPSSLPDGALGVQYAGNVDGGRYDLSVFAPEVFATVLTNQGSPTVQLDTQDQQWIVKQLTQLQANTQRQLDNIKYGNDKQYPFPHSLSDVFREIEAVKALVSGGSTGAVNVDQLATQLVAALGPLVAKDVAAELARRLAA